MHLSDDDLDAGKLLLDQRSEPAQVKADQKGLWVLAWRSDPTIETEIWIGRRNVKAYSCECKSFEDRKMCSHVVAGIQYIVQELEKKKKARAIKSKERQSGRKSQIHAKGIIEKLDIHELREFLLQQSSKNALVAGELKARYAYKIDTGNQPDKYFLLIKRYASALSQGRLTSQKFEKLQTYIVNLVDHAADLIASKNYVESHLIIYGLMKYYMFGSGIYQTTSWEEIYSRIHNLLVLFFKANIPLELSEDLIEKLRALYKEYRYVVMNPGLNLFVLMYEKSFTKKDDIYFDLVEHARSNSRNNFTQLSLFEMAACRADKATLQSTTNQYVTDLPVLKLLFSVFLNKKGQDDLKEKMLFYLYETSRGERIKAWAFEELIQQSIPQERKVDLYVDQILTSKKGQIDLILALKECAGKSWSKVSTELAGDFEETGQIDLCLEVLVLNNDYPGIRRILEKYDDAFLLLGQASYLYDQMPNYFEQAVEAHLIRHLDTHVGYQSAEFLLHIFNSLSAQNLSHLVEKYYAMVVDKFSERKYLLKMLREVV